MIVVSIFQDNVYVADGDTSFSFLDHGYTEEDVLSGRFCAILLEKGADNHFCFFDWNGKKGYYGNIEIPCFDIRGALDVAACFKNLPVSNEYSLYSIRILDEITVAWAKSFMPKKRSSISKDIRKRVYDSCDGRCAYCGCLLNYSEMQVDHVDSHYRHWGQDIEENYLPSCRDCNGLKSDYLLEEFRNVLIPNAALKAKYGLSGRNERICKKYKLQMGIRPKKIEFYFEKMKKK